MQVTELPILTSWQNFFIITGSAAATLTGLMFIAVSLLAGVDRHVSTLNAAIAAFSTPTIVHFGVVLLMAGILSAPWQAFEGVRVLLGLLGLGTAIYLITRFPHLRNMPDYQTPLRDWLWYLIFPLSAYVVLIGTAIALPANPALVLYLIGAVMVVLLFIGIRNAWDLVTFLAVEQSHPEK